jgi:FHS family L-fucose permease-like MFS transporter
MLGIYVYVGVEVSIQSNFGGLLKTIEFGGYKENEISHFIALYWGSMMIGRWTGAVSVFNISAKQKMIWSSIVPFIAFAIVLLVNYLAEKPISELLPYAGALVVLVLANLWSKESPVRMMLAFSTLGAIAMIIGIMTTGKISTYAFISGGLFCSVMWPCIFSMSITGLGKYTSQGSAFLIMMILGGAVIPPLQGAIADTSIGIHQSYWIPVLCFIFLILYTFVTKKTLQKQGLEIEEATGGH